MELNNVKELVAQLIALMNDNDLDELEVEEDGARIRLKKSVDGPPMVAAAMHAAPAGTAAAGETQAPAEAGGDGTIIVPSPIVGTFYRAAGPDTDAFVDVGDTVDDESVVCIIEAMKVMNEIKAAVSGTIVACLVENGEPVEYGEALFRVKQAE